MLDIILKARENKDNYVATKLIPMLLLKILPLLMVLSLISIINIWIEIILLPYVIIGIVLSGYLTIIALSKLI